MPEKQGRTAGGMAQATAGGASGSQERDAVWREFAALPHVGDWPGLDAAERERRAHVLWEIATRIARDGPHRAAESAERGRQFMPFAALRGLDELDAEVEDDAAREPAERVRGHAGRDDEEGGA